MKVALRSLLRQPVFTTVVVLSLAIGIGLDTTMYGVLDALMRPRIDMRSPEQLYWVRLYGIRHGELDNRAFDAAVASGQRTYESTTRSDASRTDIVEAGQNMLEATVRGVASNFFQVTGARVLAGRTFVSSDELGETKPLVITDQFAEKLFGKGHSPVGARVIVGHEGHVIVGVVSQTTNFPREDVSAWEISEFNPLGVFIRLVRVRDGVTRKEAEHELGLISASVAAAANVNARDVAFRFHQASDPGYQVAGFHLALILAVSAVLLVACANLANIQLARGLGRRREIALRSALGASRRRIVLDLLAESAFLVSLGLALGLVATYWGSKLLVASIPPRVGTYIVEPQFSWRVLAFSLVATTLCLVVVGVLPALTVSRVDPNELLKSGAGTGATKKTRRFYGILVAAEIGLALVLTSGSVVLLRAWAKANIDRFSFDIGAISSGSIGIPLSATKHRYSAIVHTVADRLRGLPGIEVAAMIGMGYQNGAVTVDDGVGPRQSLTYGRTVSVVSPNYLRTLGLRIVDGRDFLEGDEGAVIVDETTARFLWGSKSPVGALIKLGGARSSRPYVRVVGVVSTFASANQANFFNAMGLGSVYYLPRASDVFESRWEGLKAVNIIARSTMHPERTPLLIRHEVAGWPDARVLYVGTMNDEFAITTGRDSARFVASLFTLFAVLGVGLAAFGVYGVVAHSVAERRRELGVRLALGASGQDILHSLLRENVIVALAGTALGLLLTKYGILLLGGMPIGEDIFNAPLFAGVALLLAVITSTAALIPALRATRIDPTESLRNE